LLSSVKSNIVRYSVNLLESNFDLIKCSHGRHVVIFLLGIFGSISINKLTPAAQKQPKLASLVVSKL